MPKSIKTYRDRKKIQHSFLEGRIIANLFPSYFIYIMLIYYTHILYIFVVVVVDRKEKYSVPESSYYHSN